MWLQPSFGDTTIYFYFMGNFTFPFLTLKVCQNPIFNIVITIRIRPSTPCSSSVCDGPTLPPPSSQSRTLILPPLLPPYHQFVWLTVCHISQNYTYLWLSGGGCSTRLAPENLKGMVHFALRTCCSTYANYLLWWIKWYHKISFWVEWRTTVTCTLLR